MHFFHWIPELNYLLFKHFNKHNITEYKKIQAAISNTATVTQSPVHFSLTFIIYLLITILSPVCALKGVLYNMEYIITSLKWLRSAIKHIWHLGQHLWHSVCQCKQTLSKIKLDYSYANILYLFVICIYVWL